MEIPAREMRTGSVCPPIHVSGHHADRVLRFQWSPACGGKYLRGRPFGGKQSVYLHHYVWLLEYGELPTGLLDHINRNPFDNRIENLRLATASINNRNTTDRKRKHDLPRNVYPAPNSPDAPFQVRFRANKREVTVGNFSTLGQAARVADNVRKLLFASDAVAAKRLVNGGVE